MKILFLCTHNACRSILAEAIARQLGQGLWQVASAGSHPAGQVHPLTLHHLHEAGYETIGLYSKSWDDLKAYHPDIVITVCDQAAGEVCPVWFGKAIKAHWGLTDPSHAGDDAAAVDAAFRHTIHLLEDRLRALTGFNLHSLSSQEIQRLLSGMGVAH